MPHFVDYFVVCGLHSGILDKDSSAGLSAYTSPLCRSYSCKVLAHYPQKQLPWNPFDESAIRTLCMPEGLIFKKNLVNPNQTHFHSFLITRENGSQAYASVLTFYEQVQDPAMLSTLDALQRSFLQTRMVTLNSADNESTFDPNTDKLYAPKCLCFVTCKPVVRPCRTYLEQLHAVTVGGRQATEALPVESFLYNILYEVPLPSPGKTTKFTGPLGHFSWSRPSKNELPLCDYSFRDFFELLGIRNVFKLLTCILLEHQILLKSADYERLMLCSNCATALLFPFTWPHVFVPILPASQRGFLDAPVPYIMGLRVDPNSVDAKYLNLPSVASLCTVDIDSGSVDFPDELPCLPNEDRLLVQVSEKLHQHDVHCSDMVDLPHSPDSLNLTPQKPSIIEAIRIMNELPENMRGSDLKKLLNESSNPHLPNLINITKRTGLKTPLSPTLSLDEGAYDLDEEPDEASEQTPVKGEHDFIPEPREANFATAIREVFASYFVEHFANYENFIIMPKQSYDQWKKNREQFQNFDKTAFLSDQPINYRAFYAAFVESSLFTQLVDEKIVTIWEPEKAESSLRLFDARVEQYRDKSGLAKLPTTPGPKSADSDSGEDSFFDISGEVINEMAPQPRPLVGAGTTTTTTLTATASNFNSNRDTGSFPQLDSNLLQVRSSDVEKVPQPSPEMTGYRRVMDHFGLRRGSGSDSKLTSIAASPAAVHRLRSSRSSGSSGFGFSSHSHAKFVSQLMRESRLRVKHMLGTTGESANTIEENTHIAYLCDLLERIWGHGLKKRESKSPLWAHLMAYAESEGKEEFQSRQAVAVTTGSTNTSPDRVRRPHFTSSLSSIAMSSTASTTSGDDSPRSSQNLRAHFRRKKFQSPQLRSRLESILQPPPSSLVEDLLTVHNMHELKTDVGHARAWVRLALEKKALSRHLSKLLSHNELSSRRYREYAFVRTEEEREQFLYHLLTLTARDFSCFTTGFHSATMNYRILVVGEGKHFGLSTACLYVTLAGEYGMTDTLEMPRGEYQTETTCHNLGPLTCVRIGHDNSGLTPSLFVEMVLVHNTTTGQTYRFNCGRWFARSEDDSSVERLLISEKVPQTIAKSGTMSALNVDSILPSSPSRRRASRREHEEKTDMDVKLELKTVMDKIRTLSMGKNKEIVQEILQLIHGPKGFISCMEQVFRTGFRSSRKFQKKLFIWDLLERVQEQLVANEPVQPTAVEVGVVRSTSATGRGNSTSPDPEVHCQQMFLNAISRINSNNPNIGKDEKAMRFFCLGLRDDLLAGWVILVSQSPVIQSLYESHSFLRDAELLQNLVDALQLTQSVVIRLEPLFIQGL